MVLGWRKAFCTSIPREETETHHHRSINSSSSSSSSSTKNTSKFGFFSSSNPSTPRSHSQAPISGGETTNLRCRTKVNKPEQLENKTSTIPKRSPRFFSFSTPSSPRSPSTTFSSFFLKSKLAEEKSPPPCAAATVHLDERSELNRKTKQPILKVYNDDEPLMSPTSIPESEEENLHGEEFQGFLVNAASNDVVVALSPEVAVVSSDAYAVVLKVKAPSKPARRAPIDLVAVLDVSERMTSAKVQALKRGMKSVISSLSGADRLSVVAFSTTSKRLLPLRRMTAAGRRSARRIVDAIVALDGTSASANDALKKAVKVHEDRRDRNPAASILLFSDHSAAAKQKLDRFVCTTRFSHLELPVHSVALSAYNQAPHDDFFAKSIADLLSVVVQDLKIQLSFVSGSDRNKIAAVYSCMDRPTVLGAGPFRLGEFHAGEERELLIELKVPSPPLAHHVLSVKCSFKDPSTQQLINGREQALLVPLSHAVKSATSKQLKISFVTTRALAEARRLVDRNELAGAHHMLASARALVIQLVSGLGSVSGSEFVQRLECEISELQLRRQNQLRQGPRGQIGAERDGSAYYVDEKDEPLTPTSAWRAAEKLAKLAVMRKSLNRVSDLHGFENARF